MATSSTQRDEPGAVEAACRNAVEQMDELTGIQEPLAESAYVLARQIDSGKARGMGAAAVARELRETLAAMKEASGASNALSDLEAFLSAEVRDSPPPG